MPAPIRSEVPASIQSSESLPERAGCFLYSPFPGMTLLISGMPTASAKDERAFAHA